MPVPFGELYGLIDLKSVNCSVTGSKRTAPSGADAQILPLPSTSSVTAPPSGDIVGGVWKTLIFKVLVSSLPRERRPGLTSNQKSPLASRVRPWALAASPSLRSTFMYFTSPVLALTLPMVATLFALLLVK